MVWHPTKPGFCKSILVCAECDAAWVEMHRQKELQAKLARNLPNLGIDNHHTG